MLCALTGRQAVKSVAAAIPWIHVRILIFIFLSSGVRIDE
jgi:hypothetical protein